MVDVEAEPAPGEPLAWPRNWVTSHPSYFARQQSLVTAVRDVGTTRDVSLVGIVCESEADARACAEFLGQVGGLFFDEYERETQRNEA